MLAEVRDVSVVCVVWLDLGNFTRVIRYIYIYNCRIYIYIYNYIHNYDHLCLFYLVEEKVERNIPRYIMLKILPPHRLAAIETARFMLIKEI